MHAFILLDLYLIKKETWYINWLYFFSPVKELMLYHLPGYFRPILIFAFLHLHKISPRLEFIRHKHCFLINTVKYILNWSTNNQG